MESSELREEKLKLVAVVGETASGKTSLGVAIAEAYNGEVICADSRTVYQGMDIGTAKPTKADMAGIPHYGLDLVTPDQTYSAAQFQTYATGVIADIAKRNKLPILVGGTGLYIDGVLFDYSFGDKSNSTVRSELNNKTIDELTTIAQKQSIEVSPQTLKNKRHLIRVIERGGYSEQQNVLKYNSLIIGVKIDRAVLRERIERRVEVMFRRGLRKEYNELRQKYEQKNEALSGIGYQEFAEWELGDTSMSEVKRQIVKNTINLAKRQRTWFKRNPHIHWVTSADEALALVDDFLQ